MLTAGEYRKAEFGYTVAESRRGFTIHAVVYATVMTGLIALNSLLWVYADGDFPWVVFPLVGWGIGLTLHYILGFRKAADEAHARQLRVENSVNCGVLEAGARLKLEPPGRKQLMGERR